MPTNLIFYLLWSETGPGKSWILTTAIISINYLKIDINMTTVVKVVIGFGESV